MIDVNEAKWMKELFEGERAAKTDARRQAAGDRDGAGDPRIKWKMSLTLGNKRWAQGAKSLVAEGQCTMRAACRYFQLHRCPYAYRAKACGCLANEIEGASKAVITAIRQLGLSEDHEVVQARRLASR